MKYIILTEIFFLTTISIFGQKSLNEKPTPITPVPITETYFEEIIVDDYRNLENTQDSLVQNWYIQQGSYADSMLSSITGVDLLKETMKELNNRQAFYVDKINSLENGHYFYLKKNSGDDKYKLYFRSTRYGSEVLLYDPNSFQTERGINYSINYIKPSWEGEYVVVSLSHSGKELSEMIVIDVKSKKVLPQIISKVWPSSFLGISWLPDSSGIIYLQFPITDINNIDFKKKYTIRFI